MDFVVVVVVLFAYSHLLLVVSLLYNWNVSFSLFVLAFFVAIFSFHQRNFPVFCFSIHHHQRNFEAFKFKVDKSILRLYLVEIALIIGQYPLIIGQYTPPVPNNLNLQVHRKCKLKLLKKKKTKVLYNSRCPTHWALFVCLILSS